ncbi:TPT-domain-containing protein [Ceratobasidium sp. AG-I]|nr:TPT-domain-containing protein [Ceratobasidium sp. AG-I]
MAGRYSPIHDSDDERAGLKSFDSDLHPDLDALDIDIDDALSREQRRREWWRNALINGLFIATWFGFATVLSIYNKWMFSADKFGFPSPLFVTTMHMVMQFLLAALARLLFPSTFGSPYSPNLKQYGTKAVPCAVTTSLDIGLSNLSLKTITLSFYTMCKSSSLVFVLFFAFIFRLERFSARLIGVILLITSGVVLMVATETKFALGGMLLVFAASALGGLRWALTQMLLTGHGGHGAAVPNAAAEAEEKEEEPMGMDNPCATIYWLAPTMAVTLFTLCAIVDGLGTIFASKFFDGYGETFRTILFIVAPGTLAFCMTLAEYYIIQRTGMVPMSVAGIFKEVTTISLSAVVFGDTLNELNILGVGITIIGIALFTYHKYRKSVDSPSPAPSRPIRLRSQHRNETPSSPSQILFEMETPTTGPTPVPYLQPSSQSRPPAQPALRSPRPPLTGKKSVRFEASREDLLASGEEGAHDEEARDELPRDESENEGLLGDERERDRGEQWR